MQRFLVKHEKISFLHSSNKTFDEQTNYACDMPNGKGKLRVAIVGAGVSGLTTAIHLAPLVRSGLIDAPIDLFEKSGKNKRIY